MDTYDSDVCKVASSVGAFHNIPEIGIAGGDCDVGITAVHYNLALLACLLREAINSIIT